MKKHAWLHRTLTSSLPSSPYPRRWQLPRQLQAQRLHEDVTVALQQVVHVAVEVLPELCHGLGNLLRGEVRVPNNGGAPKLSWRGCLPRSRLEDPGGCVIMTSETVLAPVHLEARMENPNSEVVRVLVHLVQVVDVYRDRCRHRRLFVRRDARREICLFFFSTVSRAARGPLSRALERRLFLVFVQKRLVWKGGVDCAIDQVSGTDRLERACDLSRGGASSEAGWQRQRKTIEVTLLFPRVGSYNTSRAMIQVPGTVQVKVVVLPVLV